MGFWSRLLGQSTYDPAQRVLPDPVEPFWGTGGIPVVDPGTPIEFLVGSQYGNPETPSAESMWRSQPHLRKVVEFIARNVASTPLRVYERVSDTDRQRVHAGPLADVLRAPAKGMSPYRFWHSVISDGLLYDRWAVVVDLGTRTLWHVPSARLRLETDELNRVKSARFYPLATRDRRGVSEAQDLPLDRLIFDHGYAPTGSGLSPVHTLRDVLDENAESVRYRREVWENGARVPGYIHRPTDAPPWEKTRRDRFVTAMREYTKAGSRAGGLPLLEDGMELREVKAFTPRDSLDIKGRELSAVEVATAFHIAPELVGARQGNYSNMDAFRQMLFGPSLGPYIVALESVLNAQLVPVLAPGGDVYVEANVEAKMRGSFEEQAQIMQQATGGPWLTRNEARAMQNRPPIDGGDEIITPLNVVLGRPADPAAAQEPAGPPEPVAAAGPPVRVKADGGEQDPDPLDPERDGVLELLVGHFSRQEDAVTAALGAKADTDWWDADRWDAELSTDLLAPLLDMSALVATRVLVENGLEPDLYRPSLTVAYLTSVAERVAEGINAVTLEQLVAARAADEPVGGVFELARQVRAPAQAEQLTTTGAGFGALEAGQQAGARTKTWRTGRNPRPAHAALNGQTVPIDAPFSNGLFYPGSFGQADEVAGCNCRVSIGFEESP